MCNPDSPDNPLNSHNSCDIPYILVLKQREREREGERERENIYTCKVRSEIIKFISMTNMISRVLAVSIGLSQGYHKVITGLSEDYQRVITECVYICVCV